MSSVAVLGAGGMGRAMTRRLVDQGHQVVVWDRTPDKAVDAVSGLGSARAEPDISAAVAGVEVAITMLTNADAVTAVAEQFLPALPESAVWVQASTVGAAGADRLRRMADEKSRMQLDAPVSGSTAPAAAGSLEWLVSGPQAGIERAHPVLAALGNRIQDVGDAQEASRLKLAINAWMTAATVAFTESLTFCDALGVDRKSFTDALHDAPLGMPYLLQKVDMIAKREYPAGFPVELARKDAGLAREAAGSTELSRLVAERLQAAVDAGHGRDDLGAVAEVAPRPE